MPALQQAVHQYQNEGLLVLAVNAGENQGVVRDFLDAQGLDLPVLLDPGGQIRAAYGVGALPVTVWIDAAGVVRAEQLGPVTPETIAAAMRKLLGEP